MFGANSRFNIPKDYSGDRSGRWHNRNNSSYNKNTNYYASISNNKINSKKITVESNPKLQAVSLFWEKYQTSWQAHRSSKKTHMKVLARELEKELCRKYQKNPELSHFLTDNQGCILSHVSWLVDNKHPKQAQEILDLFLCHRNFYKTRQLATLCTRVATSQFTTVFSILEAINEFSRLGIPMAQADRSALQQLDGRLAGLCKNEMLSYESFQRLRDYNDKQCSDPTTKECLSDALDAYVWTHLHSDQNIEAVFQNYRWKAGSVNRWIDQFDENRTKYLKEKHWTAIAALCTPNENIQSEKTITALQDFLEYALTNSTPLYFYAAKLVADPSISQLLSDLVSQLCHNQEKSAFLRSLLLFIYDHNGNAYDQMASLLTNIQPDEINGAWMKKELENLWGDLLDHACKNESPKLLDISVHEGIISYCDRFKTSEHVVSFCANVMEELKKYAANELHFESTELDKRISFLITFGYLEKKLFYDENSLLPVFNHEKIKSNFLEVVYKNFEINAASQLSHNQEKAAFLRLLLLFIYDHNESAYDQIVSLLTSAQFDEINKVLVKKEIENLWDDLLDHAYNNESPKLLDFPIKEAALSYFDRFKTSDHVVGYCKNVMEELKKYTANELHFGSAELDKRINFLIAYGRLEKKMSFDESPLLQVINHEKIKSNFSEVTYKNFKTKYYGSAIADCLNDYCDLGSLKTPEQRNSFQADAKSWLYEVSSQLSELKKTPEVNFIYLINNSLHLLCRVEDLPQSSFDDLENGFFNALPKNHYKLKKYEANKEIDFSVFLNYEDFLYAYSRAFKLIDLWKKSITHNLPVGSEAQTRVYERIIKSIAISDFYTGGKASEGAQSHFFYEKFSELGWFNNKMIGNSKAKDVCRLLYTGKADDNIDRKKLYKDAFNFSISETALPKAYRLLTPMLEVFKDDPELGRIIVQLLKAQQKFPQTQDYNGDHQIFIFQRLFNKLSCSTEQKKEILNEIVSIYQMDWAADTSDLRLAVGFGNLISNGLRNNLYDVENLFKHLEIGLDMFALLNKRNNKFTPNTYIIQLGQDLGLKIPIEKHRELLKSWLKKIT